MSDKVYEAVFRKADELGWKGEEQFMGELVEIVDAALNAHEGLNGAPRTRTRQFCGRCNSVDRVGFLAPKELWRLVAGPRWEHDILCLACFAEIGDEKGIRWDLFELEFYPMSYVTLQANRVSDGGSET